MATISQQEFLKGGKKIQLVAPASENIGVEKVEKPGFFTRVKEDINKRADNLGEIADRRSFGQQGLASSALQTAGQAAGALGDVISQAGVSAFRALPDSVEQPVRNAGTAILKTSVGQAGLNAIEKGMESYNQWKVKNPEAAGDLEAVVNIASIFPAAKGAQLVDQGAGKVLQTTGKVALDTVEKAKPIIGKGMLKAGEKIEITVIKPSAKDVRNGFKIENVTKHDVGGNLSTAYNKTNQKIQSYAKELNSIIKQNPDQKPISLSGVLEKLKSQYKGRGISGLGTQKKSLATIQEIEDELDLINPNWRKENINLEEAVYTKRAAGLKSAFEHDPTRNGISAEEQVWNDLYLILKDETEGVSSKEFGDANKALSELIPIEQAIIRRIPIAERNNVFSLTDLISLAGTSIEPTAISIGVVNRLLKSGTVANALMKGGKKLIK